MLGWKPPLYCVVQPLLGNSVSLTKPNKVQAKRHCAFESFDNQLAKDAFAKTAPDSKGNNVRQRKFPFI